jgi:hypothetical protein
MHLSLKGKELSIESGWGVITIPLHGPSPTGTGAATFSPISHESGDFGWIAGPGR